MIVRKKDTATGCEVTFWDDGGEQLLFRVVLPPGITYVELERFIEHLRRERVRREEGPN